MSKEFYWISLKVILKNEEGKILGLKGVPTGTLSGYFDLPGGRVDDNEFGIPFDQIINREIAEEIGDVKFKILSPIPVSYGRSMIDKRHTDSKEKDVPVLYLFFEAEYLGGEINNSEEHTGWEWLDIRNIELDRYFKTGILEGIKMYLNNKK